ncbi:unnamed protein product [Blumeria hordei]|uniref:Spindle pole body-associated protein cut12 domain-containing protein n=1 Tax=Blumeria hordei TaxID=2867405 RepID=A0A383UWA3_BLUHO|nr:unnamed protein product [Blumeria hordei]
MLAWWLGGRRPKNERYLDEPHGDAPETPAPVFAARAFKSALFGSPGSPANLDTNIDCKPTSFHDSPCINNLPARNNPESKLPGILVTPGVSNPKRKTVTFGSDVRVNEIDVRKHNSKTSNRNQLLGELPIVPLPPKFNSNQSELNKSSATDLDDAPDQKFRQEAEELTHVEPIPLSSLSPEETNNPFFGPRLKDDKKQDKILTRRSTQHNSPEHDLEGDMTIDLNNPHSQSGKYWKLEFETYHQEAKSEMRKLLAYKELAKSYAKKKDIQSVNLAEKLREEQKKVLIMEEKISRLSAMIATADREQDSNESPELIEELTRQAASAIQYKKQVEEFRKLVENIDSSSDEAKEHQSNHTKPENHNNNEPTVLITKMSREIKNLKKQLEKMTLLQNENKILHGKILEKDEKIARLKLQNTSVKREASNLSPRLTDESKSRSNDLSSCQKHEDLHQCEFETLKRNTTNVANFAKVNSGDSQSRHGEAHAQVQSLNVKKTELGSHSHHETQNNLTHRYDFHSSAGNENCINIDRSPIKTHGRMQHTPLSNKSNLVNVLSCSPGSRFCSSAINLPYMESHAAKFKQEDLIVDEESKFESNRGYRSSHMEPNTPISTITRSRSNKDTDHARTLYSRTRVTRAKSSRVELPPDRFKAASKRLAAKKMQAACRNQEG